MVRLGVLAEIVVGGSKSVHRPVALESIPTQGLDVVVQEWAMAACAEGLGGRATAVSGALHVVRAGKDVGVRGPLAGTAGVTCDRCGAEVLFHVDTQVDCLYLAPRPEADAVPESDYAELGEYDGVSLDLGHVVVESLALERPLRVLCGDVDPAADAACLARWRDRAGPVAPVGDPRFAVLKNIKPVQ